jgi:hypothetical protein
VFLTQHSSLPTAVCRETGGGGVVPRAPTIDPTFSKKQANKQNVDIKLASRVK